MNILKSSNIKQLHSLTRQYHSAKKVFSSITKNMHRQLSPDERDKLSGVVDELNKIQDAIMENINCKFEVVHVDGKGFALRDGNGAFARYEPNHDNTVIKHIMSSGPISDATFFKDKEQAEEMQDSSNYAVFRAYIHGIGKSFEGEL